MGMCTNLSGPTIEQPKELGAVTFEGITDPLIALTWLAMFENILQEGVHCPYEDKVKIAGFLLEGDART